MLAAAKQMKIFIYQTKGFFLLLILAVSMLGLTGCSSLFKWKSTPNKAVVKPDVFAQNGSNSVVTMEVLQMKVMRFADDYVATIAQAADDLAVSVGTSEARLICLKWKTGQATSAYTDATGANPVVNALDMLVLVSMARMVVEDYGIEKFGTNAIPLLAVHARLENSAWELAGGALKPAQKTELSNLIQEWRKKNPKQRYIGPIRFMEFANAVGHKPSPGSASPNSIFSLLFIDPFAGLDPTTAAIEEAQQFGERMMYYGQRMPLLLSWQAEVVAMELANQPESRQLLTNAQQLSSASVAFSQAAAQLPQVINAQREAAIDQIFDRLRSEGTNSRAVLTELHEALDAGDNAAKSINAAIKSLDEFVRYVTKANTTNVSANTNGRSFNVLEYGVAATQIGQAAKELNAAITSLNQATPELKKISKQATEDANQVITRAFIFALILIAILLVGAVLAGLTFRAIDKRNNPGCDGKDKKNS